MSAMEASKQFWLIATNFECWASAVLKVLQRGQVGHQHR